MAEWIKRSDIEPSIPPGADPYDHWILVFTQDDHYPWYETGLFIEGVWVDPAFADPLSFTHWMPLSTPPKHIEVLSEFVGTLRCMTSDGRNVNMAEELNRIKDEP